MGNKGVKDQQRLQMYYKSKCWDPRTDSFDAVAAASNRMYSWLVSIKRVFKNHCSYYYDDHVELYKMVHLVK